MPALLGRLKNFLISQDEALAELGGAKLHQTISGSVGRACETGKWWGPILRAPIDKIFGKDHCAQQAERER